MTTIYVETNTGTQYDIQVDITGSYVTHITPGNTGIWSWVVEKYGFIRQTGTFDSEIVNFSPSILFALDSNISQATRSVVEAYTEFSNLDQLYDYSAFVRTQHPERVFAYKDGEVLDFGNINLVFSSTETTSWNFDELTNTLTLKSSLLTRGFKFAAIRTLGTIVINTGSAIQCIYITNVGVSQNVEVRDVPAGSSLAFYDENKTIKKFVSNAVGGVYTLYIEPGISEVWSWALESYGKNRNSGQFPTDFGGVLFFVPDNVTDVNISQPSLSSVLAYSSIGTLDQLYDVAAAYRMSEEGIVFGDKIQESNTSLLFGLNSLVIDATASTVFSATDSQIIIKSENLVIGNKFNQIVSENTITKLNGAVYALSAIDITGTNSLLTISGVNPGVLVKLMNGTTVLATGVSSGSSVVLPYTLGAGVNTLNASLFAEKAAGNVDGYNLFTGAVILNRALTTTLINMTPDPFYGRSGSSLDRNNVSISWNVNTGVPTITLSADTNIKSIYDKVLESHATSANLSFYRPFTSDGNVYQFGAANFSGLGTITGSTQFYTTGTVNTKYELILNSSNTVNFPTGSLVKVILDEDNSVLTEFGVNTEGKVELTLPPNTLYRVYVKPEGYAPKAVLLNSETGRVITITPVPQNSYSSATDIDDLIPLVRLEKVSTLLNVYLGNMSVIPLKVVALVDYIQQQEEYADTALSVENGNILYINDSNQLTPVKNNVNLLRETTLPTNQSVMWQTFFSTGSLSYPDFGFTPADANQLFINSFSAAVGQVVIMDSQIATIASTAVNQILDSVLANGKTVRTTISETGMLTNIISSEVQKPN